MTGFESKRKAAQAKLDDDDDTQAIAYTYVYADTLLISYQQGFADGKRSEQRKPLTEEAIWQIANDCTIGGDLHADKFARAIEAKLKVKNDH